MTITSERAAEIVKYAAPIMAPNVPSEDIQDVIDYLTGISDNITDTLETFV